MVKLTEWQANYKNHVDETQEKVDTLLTHMGKSVTILQSSSEKIAQIDVNLGTIESSISNLSVSAEDISAHVENLKLQNQNLKEDIVSIRHIGEEAKTVIPVITESINNLTSKLEFTVLNVTEKLESASTLTNEFVEKAIEDIQKALLSYTQSVERSIEDIDKGLEEELSKALNSLAGGLAALSGKFVEDYQPLTERLREIVRLAEDVDA